MLRLSRFIWLPILTAVITTPAAADYLGGITFSHPRPSFLTHTEYVDITIDYKVTEAGGGIVFARPYTNGAPTPGYSASGGHVVSAGSGTTDQYFRIMTGEQVVDHVRFTLVSPDQSQTWLDVSVPVYYHYGPNGAFNISPSFTEHSALRHDQQFSVSFDFSASDAAGCFVFARPYTNGAPTPGYVASGSTLMPQSGNATQWFTFNGDADVTHIRIYFRDHDNSALLWECFVPFTLHWREIGIYNISFDRTYESSLHNTQNLTASFTLDHLDATGGRIWTQCMTDGGYTPGGIYQGSALEPPGAHAVTRYSRVDSGEQDVDTVRFHATAGEADVVIFVPVRYHWASHAMQNPVFMPASPAILSNGEFLSSSFDYITSATGNVRMYMRPALNYEVISGDFTYTSTNSPPPSGSETLWCTFNSGSEVADSMRFGMYSSDWTDLLLFHYYHGQWVWGGPAVVTPVPEVGEVAVAQLDAVHPNPFNPATSIPVTLTADASVRLAVFDLRGRLVQTLVNGDLAAGHHVMTFDGTGLPSGTYVCRLDGPGGVQTRRMTLVK